MADPHINIPNPDTKIPLSVRGVRPLVFLYAPGYRPVATYVLLGLIALAFLVQIIADAATHPGLYVFLIRTFTGVGADPRLLIDLGATYPPSLHQGEYWRLVVPMFLHIGMLHLLINGYALYILGLLLERVYDYGRFALIYVGAGMASSLASMSRSEQISAGASGAIMGIAGAMVVTGYFRPWAVPKNWHRLFGAGIIPSILLTLALGFVLPFIDNWGHIGGVLGGTLLALLIPPPKQDLSPGPVSKSPLQGIVALPLAVVLLATVAAAKHYRTAQTVARLVEEGARYREKHDLDHAIDRFRQAAALSRGDTRPHEQLGSVYLEQNRVADAIRQFDEALRLDPESPDLRLDLARAYRENGDSDKAQELIEAVEKSFDRTAEGQAQAARVFDQDKLYPEAIQHYQQALGLKPDLAVAHNNLAWLYATCADRRYRNPQAALQHARRAVELDHWKQPAFVDTLAEALYFNGNFTEAVKTQTRALELSPNDRELQEHMARYRKAAGS